MENIEWQLIDVFSPTLGNAFRRELDGWSLYWGNFKVIMNVDFGFGFDSLLKSFAYRLVFPSFEFLNGHLLMPYNCCADWM
jgi:hypothetical protein